ncbi:MAG: dihydrolipoamide acetyltransferase family protein [Thermoleophilia bacterium]
MARERGIDLTAVTGTGPDGRIVADDVERAAAAPAAAPAPAVEAPAPAAAPAPAPAAAPAPPPVPALAEAVTTVPLSNMRKVIARRMSEAWQAPHFVVSMTADMRDTMGLRERLVERTPDGAVKPTLSDVITKLVALALVRHPAMNAHYSGDAVHQLASVNIGLAVAVEGGLVVPVIHGCERRTIAEIAAARADIVERARANRLAPADFEGGTFTISNLGMYGVEQFMAVLNPPQVGILAVGAIQEQVVARKGKPVVRPRMEMSLSCDHRAVDGATGSEFLRTLKTLLEEPVLAL